MSCRSSTIRYKSSIWELATGWPVQKYVCTQPRVIYRSKWGRDYVSAQNYSLYLSRFPIPCKLSATEMPWYSRSTNFYPKMPRGIYIWRDNSLDESYARTWRALRRIRKEGYKGCGEERGSFGLSSWYSTHTQHNVKPVHQLYYKNVKKISSCQNNLEIFRNGKANNYMIIWRINYILNRLSIFLYSLK